MTESHTTNYHGFVWVRNQYPKGKPMHPPTIECYISATELSSLDLESKEVTPRLSNESS